MVSVLNWASGPFMTAITCKPKRTSVLFSPRMNHQCARWQRDRLEVHETGWLARASKNIDRFTTSQGFPTTAPRWRPFSRRWESKLGMEEGSWSAKLSLKLTVRSFVCKDVLQCNKLLRLSLRLLLILVQLSWHYSQRGNRFCLIYIDLALQLTHVCRWIHNSFQTISAPRRVAWWTRLRPRRASGSWPSTRTSTTSSSFSRKCSNQMSLNNFSSPLNLKISLFTKSREQLIRYSIVPEKLQFVSRFI